MAVWKSKMVREHLLPMYRLQCEMPSFTLIYPGWLGAGRKRKGSRGILLQTFNCPYPPPIGWKRNHSRAGDQPCTSGDRRLQATWLILGQSVGTQCWREEPQGLDERTSCYSSEDKLLRSSLTLELGMSPGSRVGHIHSQAGRVQWLVQHVLLNKAESIVSSLLSAGPGCKWQRATKLLVVDFY